MNTIADRKNQLINPQQGSRSIKARQASDPMVDLQKIVLRHKSLVALGIIIGLVVGAIYYAQATPVYRSSADVLIVSKRPETVAGVSTSFFNDYMSTHQALLTSAVIVNRASQHPSLASMNLGDIRFGLDVQPSEVADNILTVAFDSEVPEDCAVVVNAVLESYQDFLEEVYRSMSSDTVEQISVAKDDLLDQLRKQEQAYRTFREQSPILTGTDENGANPVLNRLLTIQTQQSDLLIRRTELESQLASIEHAKELNLDTKYLRFLVSNLGIGIEAFDAELDPNDLFEADQIEEMQDDLELSESLETTLLPLLQQQSELLQTFGPNHPTLASVQIRIRDAKQHFARLKSQRHSYHSAVREDGIEDDSDGYRHWTDSDRQRVLAQLVEDGEEEITLEQKDSSELLTLRIDELNSEDRKALETIRAERVRDDEIIDFGLSHLNHELERIKTTEAMLQGLYEQEYDKAKQLTAVQLAEAEFQRNMRRTQQLYDGVVAQLQDANLSKDYGGFEADVISPAGFARKVKPEALTVFIMAAFLGAAFGTLLAYIAELADRTFRTSDELEKHLGLPIIARILQGREGRSSADTEGLVDASLCTFHRPISPESESFRGLRTSLFFNNRVKDQNVIQVTSACPGDGKSTVAANLCVSIAQSGKKVLLIDADLRKPRQHEIFHVDLENGLSEVIMSERELDESIRPTVVKELSILPAGRQAPDPAELLTSQRFGDVISAVALRYDYVIVDTGPLLAITDPRIVMSHVDSLVFTVRIAKTSRKQAEAANELLASLDAPIAGVVANAVSLSESYGYGYGYGYSYGYGTRNGAKRGGTLDNANAKKGQAAKLLPAGSDSQ